MQRSRQGFTLFEVLVTIAIIAVVAMVVAPSFSDDSRLRLMAASAVLASDIEFAQVMTITQPNNSVVVRFDAAQDRYWLASAATPDTPILRDDTGDAYLVEMGLGRAAAAAGVTITIADMTDATLTFNPQGGLEDFTSTPAVTLGLNGQAILLEIAAATGTITETNVP